MRSILQRLRRRSAYQKSPTALKLAKFSFNADTDHIHGITEMGFSALELYYQTPEAQEGRNAANAPSTQRSAMP